MPNCTKCDVAIKSEDLSALLCCKCSAYWHVLCAGLRSTPRDKHNWRCDLCRITQYKKQSKGASNSRIDTEGIVSNIKDLRKEIDSLKKDMSKEGSNSKLNLEERIDIIEAKLLDLESVGDLVSGLYLRVAVLEERNHYMEQFERVKNLEFHGLTEHDNEQLLEIVLRIATLLEVAVTATDIKWVGRIGPNNQRSCSNPRPVLIIFNDQAVKNSLMRTMRKNRGVKMATLGYADDNKRVFVRENLTPTYRDIFQKARQLPNFEFAWTYNCRVYIRKDRDSEAIHIKTKRQLNTIFYHYSLD
ncbi:uncharacterized protein [Battus philenor]|uniref:uncharacterized protein n=1 Tax=Battus philenor TaxID=42288 RepID=UPI0035D0FC4D